VAADRLSERLMDVNDGLTIAARRRICPQSLTSLPPLQLPKLLHGYWHLLVTGVVGRAGGDRDVGVCDTTRARRDAGLRRLPRL